MSLEPTGSGDAAQSGPAHHMHAWYWVGGGLVVLALLALWYAWSISPPRGGRLYGMISRAASMDQTDWNRLRKPQHFWVREYVGDQPLTFVVFMRFPKDYVPAGAKREVTGASGWGPTLWAIEGRRWLPARPSLIQPAYVTSCTRNVQGDTMTGTVTFSAPGAYNGTVDYVARRTRFGWRIEEFHMPVIGFHTCLTDDGVWRATFPAGAFSAPLSDE